MRIKVEPIISAIVKTKKDFVDDDVETSAVGLNSSQWSDVTTFPNGARSLRMPTAVAFAVILVASISAPLAQTPAYESAVPTHSFKLTAGAPALFMSQQETLGYGFQWGPSDGSFGAIPLGDGLYRFFGGAHGGDNCPSACDRRIGVFSFRGTLDRVACGNGCGIFFGAGDGPAGWLFDANYSGSGQLIRFAAHGKKGWLMTFRGEYWWTNSARPDGLCQGGVGFPPVPCYYSTLGLAVSTDNGETFKVAGESLQLTDPLSASKGGSVSRNIGYGSLVMADANGKHIDNPPADPSSAYVYLIFVSSGTDLAGVCKDTRDKKGAQCPGIARARYADVVSAVFSGDPNTVAALFRKYDTDSPDLWSQPGTGDSPDLSIGGGKFSPLYQGQGLSMVVYDRAFDVYLGAVRIPNGPGRGVAIRTSTDLIHWSDPIGPVITDGSRSLTYVTLLGETGVPTIADEEPRLYFRSTPEGQLGWPDSVFKVVRLKLSRR